MWRLKKVRNKLGGHGGSLEEFKFKRREHEKSEYRLKAWGALFKINKPFELNKW